ncbi:MAG: glycosyltransferase [Alphaproteobacteria bacterium]|nr:glycosyltransferase [Alphaproteobacteria bacterium]
MRTVFILPEAFGGYGGIAKFNRELIETLCARPDCDEVVALPRHVPMTPQALPGRLYFDVAGTGGVFAYLLRCLRWFVLGKRFDLILCGHLNLLPFAWLLKLRSRAPVVLIVHGVEAWEPNRRALVNLLARRLDHVIVVSHFTLHRFAGWSGVDRARMHVLRNCVDLSLFSPGPPNPALVRRYAVEGKRVILTLGRLDANERAKGFDQIIGAMPALLRERDDVVYMIVGSGTDRARLERKARALGMGDRVIFTGYIEEDEKPDHYRLADLYAMPGRGEGYGIAYLEAMACGVPVVGSTLDASRETLREGRLGAVIDPDDPDAVLAALRDGLDRGKGAPPAELAENALPAFAARANEIFDMIAAATQRS